MNQAKRDEEKIYIETDEIEKNTNTEKNSGLSSTDILKQINTYLENEKKDL